jgi:hypothetical protein
LFPAIRLDDDPDQPKSLASVEEQNRVAVWQAGCVGREEHLAPEVGALCQAGALDHDVVRCALAGSMKPDREKIAVGQFDDGTAMNMFGLGREDQSALKPGRRGFRPRDVSEEEQTTARCAIRIDRFM